jgi:HAD superfamily hydrolase (TIGR01509 family)
LAQTIYLCYNQRHTPLFSSGNCGSAGQAADERQEKQTMIQAVIFDLGGTLLEYKRPGATWLQFEQVGAEAVFAHLAGQGHALPSLDVFVAGVIEQVQLRWRQVTDRGGNFCLAGLLRDVCLDHGVALSAEEIAALVHAYTEPLSTQTRPLPGAKETLHTLHARGLKLGLISNTMWPGRYHLADLARHGLAGYFQHTLFSADAGVWKPHPEIFHRSLAALAVAPHEAVFVGDFLPHDIAGAQGVGMKGVHIATGEFSADGAQPDGRISALAELPALIDQWEVQP